MKTIFVVDDDGEVRELVRRYLEKEGFAVRSFASAGEAREGWQQQAPDMCILDVMMPELDGLDFCREIKKKGNVPVVFLSARVEEFDRVLGLEMGADDYVPKPFSPRELVARVKGIFRRLASSGVAGSLCVGDVTALVEERRAVVGEAGEVDLTAKEYELLVALMRGAGKALSREMIIDAVWGCDYYGDERAVDDLVKRLRRKLREKGSDVEISTVWGYGYKLHA